MLDLSTVRIAFLGFGNMASAMADGWIRSGAVKPEQLGAASRRQDVLEARTKARGMKAFATCEEAARWADVVVVAVKPHLVEGVVKPIRGILKDRLVLSVAVGRLFDFYESILESGAHPGAMKDAVCSPGGTTIIGVAALERKGFRSAVIDAIDAIETRSR